MDDHKTLKGFLTMIDARIAAEEAWQHMMADNAADAYADAMEKEFMEKESPLPEVKTPLEVQEGGTHYKRFKIQPAEYNHANNIPFMEGNIIKYVTRWKYKDGLKDLKKARHCIDILIELENRGANI